MITKNREIEHYENRSGGIGYIHIERLLPTDIMNPHVKMYAKITVDKGASIGYHMHHKDAETYYILQGKALYNDNGKEMILEPGDCTYTASGHSHGITNISDEDLIFIAMIIPN